MESCATDGEDELEVGVEERVGGGDHGETAGEAEAHDADGASGAGGEPVGGFADGAHGGGVDVVVLDVGQLGREHADAATGHGGGEGHEARLVDAEVVDTVEDDECRGVGFVLGQIEARADAARFDVEGDVLAGDGVGDEIANDAWNGLAGDEIEDGDGLQVGAEEGPSGEDEDKDAGAEEREEDRALDELTAGSGGDCAGAGAGGAEAVGEPMQSGRAGWVFAKPGATGHG